MKKKSTKSDFFILDQKKFLKFLHSEEHILNMVQIT